MNAWNNEWMDERMKERKAGRLWQPHATVADNKIMKIFPIAE